MTSPFKTTYGKVIFLLAITSIFMLGLLTYLYYYTLYEEEKVYESYKSQFSKETNLLLKLKSDIYTSAVNDLSYWDEHIDYVNGIKNIKWFDQNVASITEPYQIDYIASYDINQNLIAEKQATGFNNKIHISKDFFSYVQKNNITKFYYQSSEGLLEVFAAYLHPTNDYLKKVSDPEGMFILVNHLDEAYFNGLKEISDSDIKIISSSEKPTTNKNEVVNVIPLKDFKGKILKQLVFKRGFKLSFVSSKEIIQTIVACFILTLIIFAYFLKKYIFEPLYITTRVLEEGKIDEINNLRKRSGEFGYIGNLFLENDKQNLLLIAAKEKAEESDKLKSSFLTNLSHEIRTPMNAIIGFTDLLEDPNLPNEEKLKYINIVKQSGKNLVYIIDDLIKMSKIDTQQIKPNYAPFSLNDFMHHIKETIEIIVPKTSPIEIVLDNTNNNNLETKLISDETKLRQIIINLLNNAVKFTNKGQIIFGYTPNYDSNLIEFFISDTGIGIDEKDLKHIFSRFHKIQTDENMNLYGLGLGLAISKAYVEMLDGQLWVESKKDVGTTFKFTIPLNLRNELKSETKSQPKETNTIRSENLIILVAEDNNINFMLSKRILGLKNHTVIRAKNGQEAVDICKQNDMIDIVLMDIKMPILNGIEANRFIKTFKPELPIIAHTAYSTEEDKIQIFNEGFVDVVTKPLDKEKLYRSLNRVKLKIVNH